jgi:hypothetical protein
MLNYHLVEIAMNFEFNIHIKPGKDCGEIPADPEEIIEPGATLRFTLTYPLTNHYTREETHANGKGWTRKQFINAVRRAYLFVYREEGAHPGYVPGMMNRAKSNGPYGICCHDRGDLFLEGAYSNKDGSWGLNVGS